MPVQATKVMHEVFDPARLDIEQKDQLCTELYATHSQVFDGVSEDEFRAYVIDSKANKTRIQLLRAPSGELVGYIAVHIFERVHQGRLIAVARAESGSFPAYRGKSAHTGFYLRQMLAYKLRHPLRPLFYLGAFVHPSSYRAFDKYTHTMWPRRGCPMPAAMVNIACCLADEFGLARIPGKNPLIRDVGWRTKETEADRDYWQGCRQDGTEFFIEFNKDYEQGEGMLLLIQCTLANFILSVPTFLSQCLKRPLKKSQHRLVRLLERGYAKLLGRQTDFVRALPTTDQSGGPLKTQS